MFKSIGNEMYHLLRKERNMRKIIVDEKEIVTNYGEKTMDNLVSGDDLPDYI